MSDNIITITDFMDPNLDVYARLTENQLLNRANPKEGMFIAESPKVIERALDAGVNRFLFCGDKACKWRGKRHYRKVIRIYLYILRHLICSQS